MLLFRSSTCTKVVRLLTGLTITFFCCCSAPGSKPRNLRDNLVDRQAPAEFNLFADQGGGREIEDLCSYAAESHEHLLGRSVGILLRLTFHPDLAIELQFSSYVEGSQLLVKTAAPCAALRLSG